MPWIKLSDGTRAHVKLGGRRVNSSPFCKATPQDRSVCGKAVEYLCDHPVNGEAATCDMPLCADHAHVVGVDRHHCPKHYKPEDAA